MYLFVFFCRYQKNITTFSTFNDEFDSEAEQFFPKLWNITDVWSLFENYEFWKNLQNPETQLLFLRFVDFFSNFGIFEFGT